MFGMREILCNFHSCGGWSAFLSNKMEEGEMARESVHRIDAACRSAVSAYRRVQNIHADARNALNDLPSFSPRKISSDTTKLLTVCRCEYARVHSVVRVTYACHAWRARFRHFVSAVAPTYLPATAIRCWFIVKP